MATYKGKNTLKSVMQLARERAIYNSEVKGVTDFNFAEKTLYGRVDPQHNPIVADSLYLKPIMTVHSDIPLPIMVMNFVSEQFRDFERHFAKGCQLGFVEKDDPVFSALNVKRGYDDPNDFYEKHYGNIMELFVFDYLTTRASQIHGFDDFVNFFVPFMKQMTETFPITLSGFQRSYHSNIFTSGLAIDIGGIMFDDDEQKQKKILDTPSYTFFKKTAQQYGFLINKRNPGVLVSELGSPVTQTYLNKYGMFGTSQLLRTQYVKTLHRDINILTNILLWSYNLFVSTNKIIKVPEVIKTNVVFSSRKREYINNNNINNNNIIHLYITIRNIEEEYPYNDYEIKNIFDNSVRIKKKSHDKMLEYIDDQFKSKYTYKDGTLNYYEKKLKNRLDKSC